MAENSRKKVESAGTLKIAIVLYDLDQAVAGMHRAGPGERGGAPYGRRTVATAERAAIQISDVGKGLTLIHNLQLHGGSTIWREFCVGPPVGGGERRPQRASIFSFTFTALGNSAVLLEKTKKPRAALAGHFMANGTSAAPLLTRLALCLALFIVLAVLRRQKLPRTHPHSSATP